MQNSSRKAAFVLVSSDHGTMIVNRFDYRMVDAENGYGVGFQILEKSSYDSREVEYVVSLLGLRRKYFGDGVVAIDCGANIGVHTIEWAKTMNGWGAVIAIEAQEQIYYALAGNIALNNCFNVKAILAAVAAKDGVIKIPRPNYREPGSFGSLELRQRENNEFIGQEISYSDDSTSEVRALTLDSLTLTRIDLIKLDVEGMELEALQGAMNSIQRHHPILIVEFIKTDEAMLRALLEKNDYQIFKVGLNLLAVHKADQTITHVSKK
jgi:FkbM family methyltransferase